MQTDVLGQSGPTPFDNVQLGPKPGRTHRSKTGRLRDKCAQLCGRSTGTGSCQIESELSRIRSTLVQKYPKVTRLRPNLVRHRPSSPNIATISAKFGPPAEAERQALRNVARSVDGWLRRPFEGVASSEYWRCLVVLATMLVVELIFRVAFRYGRARPGRIATSRICLCAQVGATEMDLGPTPSLDAPVFDWMALHRNVFVSTGLGIELSWCRPFHIAMLGSVQSSSTHPALA